MEWARDLAYFFSGALLTNAIPQFVSGVMGKPFQSPFAKPPGQGFSSSTVNVLWGFFNAFIGDGLLVWVGTFDPRRTDHVVAVALGALLMGLLSARMFGRFNRGDAPRKA